MLIVFSIRDSKAEYYKPFFMKTPGEALRGFEDLANDRNGDIGKYPSDFALFQHGKFDEDTGKFFDMLDQPIHLGNALDFVKGA